MIVGRRQISNITGFEENSDSSDFTCSQIDQFVQNQVNLAFFNQCYLANVMVLSLKEINVFKVRRLSKHVRIKNLNKKPTLDIKHSSIKMRLLLFCSIFFFVSVKCKFLMIQTGSDQREEVDSGVNDVSNDNQERNVVGSDYQDRDPVVEYWLHLHNKLERKCDKLEGLEKRKASLKENQKFCKAWKNKVWYYQVKVPIALSQQAHFITTH